jgi:hypothetical protein
MVSECQSFAVNNVYSFLNKNMEEQQFRIQKVGHTAPAPAPKPPATAGKRKKSMRTFPRGVLKKAKIEGVRDPARPPPRKSTLRILTDKGVEHRRSAIRKTVKAMPPTKVRETLQKAGLPVSIKTPAKLAEEILVSGMEAGMIVVK